MRYAVPVLLALVLLACGTRAPAPSAVQDPSRAGVATLSASAFPALAAQEKPVLIDFWAPWCGPCRQQGPIVEEVAGQVGAAAVVAKVNVDDEKALAAQFGVRAIPTLVILRGGKEVQRYVGVQTAETLRNALTAASQEHP